MADDDRSSDSLCLKRKCQYPKRARFGLCLLSTIMQLAGLAAIAVWLLPAFDVHLPWVLFLALGIALASYDVFTYVMGTRALERDLVLGLGSMTGMQGVAVSDLGPEGNVRICGELWKAKSVDGEVTRGTKVEVTDQEGLLLSVRRTVR